MWTIVTMPLSFSEGYRSSPAESVDKRSARKIADSDQCSSCAKPKGAVLGYTKSAHWIEGFCLAGLGA